MAIDSYTHVQKAGMPGAPLVFLLHGTGGDEHQFLDLAAQLLPSAHLVGVRGDVSEHGALRYFRRTGEGVYDMADLARATDKLGGFVAAHRDAHGAGPVVALGYSNGANILASLLFARPELIDAAILMHPLIPFDPPAAPGLAGRHVLITAGRADPICPAPQTERLAAFFEAQQARVTLAWHAGGHELRSEEIGAIQAFLRTALPTA